MSLVPSLLQAVIGLDGEALVIHVGEKPYVVAPSGQVELATRALTFEAVTGILEQMLPGESRQALEEFGAIQYELPPLAQFKNEHFTVVAARGGDDVWVEVRRHRVSDDDLVPAEIFETRQAVHVQAQSAAPTNDADLALPDSSQLWPDRPNIAAVNRTEPAAVHEVPRAKGAPGDFNLPDSIEIDRPPASHEKPIEAAKPPKVTPFPVAPKPAPAPPPPAAAASVAASAPPEATIASTPTLGELLEEDVDLDASGFETMPLEDPAIEAAPSPEFRDEPAIEVSVGRERELHVVAELESPILPAVALPPVIDEPTRAPEPVVIAAPPPIVEPPYIPPAPVVAPPLPIAAEPPAPAAPAREPITQAAFIPPPRPPEPEPERDVEPEPEPVPQTPPSRAPEHIASDEPPQHAAVVLPISRVPIHGEPGHALTGLDRLLRIAASRGASTLFIVSKARPSIRVSGEMQMLDEPPLGPDDVESLLLELMPDRNREALRTGVGTQWVCDIADVGRVSCMSFRDHRGAGGIFRMTPLRAISAEQLGLSREIRALATETEGLVLITGPRASGKTTLLSAFVDLINRTRRVYVIAIERDIRVVHESRHSLVSQREARDDHETIEAVRMALREEPDVLVLEDLRTPDLVSLALDAAGSGRLVIGTVPAQTTIAALEHIVDVIAADERRQVQLALAENLRGIVAQVLVRKPSGGQIAARELLLNSSAIASLIAEGKLAQIGPTMESGRKFGMVPLNDALVACVKSGEVDAREAYRRAADRVGFLALLKRQGIDTTFVERPA
jgi:twitching motility protein PilT